MRYRATRANGSNSVVVVEKGGMILQHRRHGSTVCPDHSVEQVGRGPLLPSASRVFVLPPPSPPASLCPPDLHLALSCSLLLLAITVHFFPRRECMLLCFFPGANHDGGDGRGIMLFLGPFFAAWVRMLARSDPRCLLAVLGYRVVLRS